MMSNQEMQFADPEWTPSTKLEDLPYAPSQPVNHTIEEEQEKTIPPYEQDKLPSGQEYPLARRPGRRIGRRAFTAGLLIASAGTVGGLLWLVDRRSAPAVHHPQSPATLSKPAQPAQPVQPAQPLQPSQGNPPQVTETGPRRTVQLVKNPPRVIVKCNGEVTITGSLLKELDARAYYSRPYTGISIISDNIHFSFNKQGNELTVTVDTPAVNDGKLFLNLTVFEYALLEVQANGNINAQNIVDTVVSLTSTSGGITFSGSLTGTSTLHSAQGIQFLGSLSENGTYYMQSDQGNVELLLPDSTLFQLHTQPSGSVTNDFSGATSAVSPQAELFITANHGDVVIKKSF